MSYQLIEVTPSGGPLGAVVSGVDLSVELPEAVIAEIRQAWLEHLVLCFPDQPLTNAQYLRFAHTIGTPVEYPFVTPIEGFPEITEIRKEPDETANFGGIWHSDTVYLDRPPMASMLLAVEVPPSGGNTQFANMYLAYDQLRQDLKSAITGSIARNSSAAAASVRTNADRSDDGNRTFMSEHPAVRVHPETDKRALYINVAHTVGLVDRPDDETRPVLEAIFAHQVDAQFVWELAWQPNMIALWDNRCVQHNPLNDYQGHRRIMRRITLEGDIPR